MSVPFEVRPNAMPVATDLRGGAPRSDDLARKRASDSCLLVAVSAHVPISTDAGAIGWSGTQLTSAACTSVGCAKLLSSTSGMIQSVSACHAPSTVSGVYDGTAS